MVLGEILDTNLCYFTCLCLEQFCDVIKEKSLYHAEPWCRAYFVGLLIKASVLIQT